jgi:saccharopine dehydrogenase-like NADP-dependent oxidoreductase
VRAAVLGGLGLQGRAALVALNRRSSVEQIICADLAIEVPEKMRSMVDLQKTKFEKVDASSKDDLVALLKEDVDVALEFLPVPLMPTAYEAAIEAGVGLVGTSYGQTIRHLHDRAVDAGVSLMPECGLDPGIDLVVCGHALGEFDELHVLNSYCGGIPEKKACDNPLNYKISWNWDLVLRAQKRPAVLIREGRKVEIAAEDQHDNEMIGTIDFPGLGELESIPNGDAVFYTDLLGVTPTIRETGRYALRWPGWCAFWAPLKKLGFLSDEPLDVRGCPVTPHQFVVRLTEPRLQYRDDEKDLVVMRNVFRGLKGGRRKTIITDLYVERDLGTGLLAMNLSVGYPASIVAHMIGSGRITRKGVLSPMVDIPYDLFMAELSHCGIVVKEESYFDDP